MFITRECDYAVRIIRALADYEMRTVREICEMEHVPQQYAYKILKKLERAQLVNGFRGSNGGYRLCKKTSQVTLYDIVSAVDENIYINECLQDGYTCPNNGGFHHCAVHQEFLRLESIIIASLQERTLDEILSGKMYS